MKFFASCLSYCGVAVFLLWLVTGDLADAAQEPEHLLNSADGAEQKVVVIKNGEFHPAVAPEVPAVLNDSLSDVVELFLRRAIIAYEEKINPPRYSSLQYILPGDYMGIIDKNGQAKAIKPEDVPEPVKKFLGEGTNPH